MCFVNLREYYEDKASGELKPGKKVGSRILISKVGIGELTFLQGISLSIEQYQALLRAVPAINAALGTLGYSVSDLDSKDSAPPQILKKESTLKEKRPKIKSNIEATSDEED